MGATITDRRRLIAVAAAVTLLLVAVIVAVVARSRDTTEAAPSPAAGAAASETFSFFAGDDITDVRTTQEETPVELGLRFTSKIDGVLPAVRFLRAHNDSSSHPVSVWSVRGGKKLGGADSSATLTGWQEVPLSSPVPIKAGEEYVVSYQADRYRASSGFFSKPAQAGPLSTKVEAGVFAYNAGTLPALAYQASNYWVDVVFQPATAAASAGPSAAGSSALSLPRVPWEGGPSYYESFPQARASGWNKPSFFPLAVWYEGVGNQQEVDIDKKMGLNTYIMLTGDSNLELVRRNRMSAMIAEDHKDRGAESVGWVLADEADMWGGAGAGKWTGKWPGQGDSCKPKGTGCGHDIQGTLHGKLPKDGRMAYANYGKGVMFWQSDEDAAKFVNDYSAVVSNDIYWYTDGNVCKAEHEGPVLGVKEQFCRRASNYGLTVDRMRTLDATDGKRQPVYNFVEVSHPSGDAALPTITGDQLAGAVMSSLIHEARGIIYFNHNFGGPCVSQHVLREKCGDTARPAVTEVNRRITQLAPVLNTQSYQWTFNPAVDTMLKAHDGSFYIFAMPGREGGTGEQTLELPPGLAGARAEVMFENRTVPITGGHLRDTFSRESSYHIYRVTP